ncbi:hypothetical protein BS78_09G065500 [Paspalum vaginatum]|nr:hypothetical protein BS78_09G065500 [Paspalum vaginatum]
MVVLRLVLLLLLACIQAGPVIALDYQIVELGKSLGTKAIAATLKKKGWNNAANGLTMMYNIDKYGPKVLDQIDKQDPAGGGGTRYNVAIDTVVINDGTVPARSPCLWLTSPRRRL